MDLVNIKSSLPAKNSRIPAPYLRDFSSHYLSQLREPDFGYILFYDHPKWHKPWFIAFRQVEININPVNDFAINAYGFALPVLRYNTIDLKLQVLDETLGKAFPPSMQYLQDWAMTTFCESLDASMIINVNDTTAEEIFFHRIFPKQSSLEFGFANGRLPQFNADFGVTKFGYYHEHQFKSPVTQIAPPRLQLK